MSAVERVASDAAVIPPGFLPLAAVLRSAPEISPRTARHICATRLGPAGAARIIGGAWYVSRDARLGTADTVAALLAGLTVRPVVDGVRIGFDPATASPAAVERVQRIIATYNGLRQFMQENRLGNEKTAWPVFRESIGGRLALKAQDVPAGHTQFSEWIRVKIPNGDIEEARGAHAKRRAAIDPADERLYDGLRLSTNQVGSASAHRTAEAQAEAEGRIVPSEKTLRHRFGEKYPLGAQVLARQGVHAYRANFEPIIQRELRKLGSGEWVVLDGTRGDLWRWVPCPRHGRRWVRPMIVIYACMGTGLIMGFSVGASESIVATQRAGIMAASRYGLWRELTTDNSKTFRGLFGPVRMAQLAELLGQAASVLGFETRFAQVRNAKAKPIEPRFKSLKELDRLDALWSGNFAHMKPHDIKRRLAAHLDDDSLSLAHYAAVDAPRMIETVSCQPSSGLDGLSPLVAFEQRRGEIRQAAPELVKLAFAQTRMRVRVVTPRGVSIDADTYGASEPETQQLVGRKVGVIPDPIVVGVVTIVSLENGRPIYRATNRRLEGGTIEELRESMAFKRGIERKHREALEGHAMTLAPDAAARIAELRRLKAVAETERQRKELPEPAAPALTIVNPALAALATQVEAKHQARRRGLPTPADDLPELADFASDPIVDEAAQPLVDDIDLFDRDYGSEGAA